MAHGRRVLMVVMVMAAVVIAASDGATNCCSECMQCPGSHGRCIRRNDLCNKVKDCLHGEDENEEFCESYIHQSCSKGQTYCDDYSCKSWKDVCSNTNHYYSYCEDMSNTDVCQAFTANQLPNTLTPPLQPPKPKIDMEQVSEYLLSSNCSRANENNTTKCPILYTDVAGTCLAVLPFELSWPAAHQVCQSIAGKLVEFEDLIFFSKIVQHLINSDFVSDFWIGGFFDLEEYAWTWSSGSMMPSSTPYWTLKYSSTCQSRQSFNGLGLVPGCFHYQQAPLTFKAGHCAALPYRYLYYMSDEPCFETKRPLCVPQISED